MAVCTRTSLFFMTTGVLAVLSACGGDDDGGVTVVDAATDAAIDAIPIDAPPVCNAPSMVCGGVCTDVTSSEEFCGNCTTACAGGEICGPVKGVPTCECAPSFVPEGNVGIAFSQMIVQAGFTVGIGVFAEGVDTNVLIGAVDGSIVEDMAYTVGTTITSPPFIGAGYQADIANMTVAASFAATAGTVTFSKICTSTNPDMAGFTATLTDATFTAVEGLMNPVPVPDGCTFMVDSVTFSIGNVGCTNQ